MPLASMPHALVFENKVKGFFPHHFSSEVNLNYVSPYPAPEFFGVERMNEKHKHEFETWYTKFCHSTFNFQKEVKL